MIEPKEAPCGTSHRNPVFFYASSAHCSTCNFLYWTHTERNWHCLQGLQELFQTCLESLQVTAFLLPLPQLRPCTYRPVSQSQGLPASWPWEPGSSRLPGWRESIHPLWNICKVLVLLDHNGRGPYTMLGSSAQQREMTHPVQAKRTHHPILCYHCVAGGGGVAHRGREAMCPLCLYGQLS